MTKEGALRKVWDYMHMHHQLKKADVILVLGSRDTQVAEHAAKLYLEGWAPVILFSGSGDTHNHKPGRERFKDSTEAEVFADIAKSMGVPEKATLIENKSQNTGENYGFSKKLLKENGLHPRTIIVVQKPYMERRAYAAGKVWWPDVDLICSSEPVTLQEYLDSVEDPEHTISTMLGDLQRIKEYPAKGFQIEQDIPSDVWEAYEFSIAKGYDKRLVKK